MFRPQYGPILSQLRRAVQIGEVDAVCAGPRSMRVRPSHVAQWLQANLQVRVNAAEPALQQFGEQAAQLIATRLVELLRKRGWLISFSTVPPAPKLKRTPDSATDARAG